MLISTLPNRPMKLCLSFAALLMALLFLSNRTFADTRPWHDASWVDSDLLGAPFPQSGPEPNPVWIGSTAETASVTSFTSTYTRYFELTENVYFTLHWKWEVISVEKLVGGAWQADNGNGRDWAFVKPMEGDSHCSEGENVDLKVWFSDNINSTGKWRFTVREKVEYMDDGNAWHGGGRLDMQC
jgi:hypothetical protein